MNLLFFLSILGALFSPAQVFVRTTSLTDRTNIRIAAFYYLEEASPQVQKTISEQLVPAAIAYYQAALKVNRLTGPITLTRAETQQCIGVDPQGSLEQGVHADLVLLVVARYNPKKVIASSGACFLSEEGRPVIGGILYNLNAKPNTTEIPEAYYENMLKTTLHEFGHILGFTPNLFDRFIDPETGNNLKKPTIEKEVNGAMVKILTLDPLTRRLQDYFACPTLEGAYLEQEGSEGAKGLHFERRIFMNEIMTGAATANKRISEFYLAFLEGTGWYTPNYEMSEPMTWGKGKGCSFLNEKCLDENLQSRFPDHFCTKLGEYACTSDHQAYAMCGINVDYKSEDLRKEFDYAQNGKLFTVDGFADNCPYQYSYDMNECKISHSRPAAAMQEEHFGPKSACFTGTVSRTEEKSFDSRPFCLKQSCVEVNPNEYVLSIELGDETIVCNERKRVTVSRYFGYIDCPDPKTFCTRDNAEFCPRGCMGRGSCVKNKCVCRNGYYDVDCSYRVVDETLAEGLEYTQWNGEEVNSHSPVFAIKDKSSNWVLEKIFVLGVLVVIVYCIMKNRKKASNNVPHIQMKKNHEQETQLEMPNANLMKSDWNNQKGEEDE